MSITEIFLFVAGAAIVVITLFLVPLLIQMRKVGEKVEKLATDLDRELPPLLKNLNESAAELRILAASINHKVAEMEQIIGVARQAADNFSCTVERFKQTVLPIVTKVGGFSAGVLAFFSYLKRSRHNTTMEE